MPPAVPSLSSTCSQQSSRSLYLYRGRCSRASVPHSDEHLVWQVTPSGKTGHFSKNQNKTNNNNKKTVHQVSQTSAFEIRSTISALKLLSCNITKVETHSSQREGGRRGGDGEIGDLSCQSKKTKQNQTKNHQVTHLKKKSVCSEKTNKKNKQQQQKWLAAQSSECYLKTPKTKQNKNKQKVVHSSLNLLRFLCMSWHVI